MYCPLTTSETVSSRKAVLFRPVLAIRHVFVQFCGPAIELKTFFVDMSIECYNELQSIELHQHVHKRYLFAPIFLLDALESSHKTFAIRSSSLEHKDSHRSLKQQQDKQFVQLNNVRMPVTIVTSWLHDVEGVPQQLFASSMML